VADRGRYLFTVSMDVDPAKEDVFNDVYNTEHTPQLMEVPGVLSGARFVTEKEVTVVIGGERHRMIVENEPKYSAIYEIDSPEVLVSDAWARAVDRGRWPQEVRPYTRNRRVVLRHLISPPS